MLFSFSLLTFASTIFPFSISHYLYFLFFIFFSFLFVKRGNSPGHRNCKLFTSSYFLPRTNPNHHHRPSTRTMTLSFDILAGNNANWGFDAFSLTPELPATLGNAAEKTAAFPAHHRTPSEPMWTTAFAAPPSRTLSGSLQSISGPAAAATMTVESGENISPMKNDALGVTLLASDPAARAFDSNLYVASLPGWFTDADLLELFKRFGPILSAKVMCHKGTHHCKGYGFVLFERKDAADVARSEMIGHVVGGNKIQVRHARSAASASLSDRAPAASGHEQQHRSGLQSPLHRASLNVAPHFSTAAPPLSAAHCLPPSTAVYGAGRSDTNSVVSATANAQRKSPQTMLVAIPNGRSAPQGPENVVYILVTSPHMQPTGTSF